MGEIIFGKIQSQPRIYRLLTNWKHEVKWVKVYRSLVPANLVRVADAPAHGVEDGHDDAAGKHDDPREQQHVGHENEQNAG